MVNASDVEAQAMEMVENRKRMKWECGRQCKPTVNGGAIYYGSGFWDRLGFGGVKSGQISLNTAVL